ncbi:efflux RND transporter periplasmic adaptor subunit [Chitinophaga arvensicola]|uniref:HlyD family secretion protein n=1 Tax=Chitinophaga arvensicola TaxID=29529 RepID=A0A1I0S7J4_9BACT|nr:efflux RND transporter periplasmic adaptor subunit [Chitinophaga arvensicola]SEW51743.1 HlyD family secretion protein [Chitinophaga arvensicola]
MKNNYIVSALAIALLVWTGCTSSVPKTAKAGHREWAADSSILPLTRPVNEQVMATIPAITADSGTRIYASEVRGIMTYDTRNQTSIASRVGGRIEQLRIKYNYQPVKKGQLIMEVYSPDLAAAQRELLYVAQNSPALLPQAKQRLQLLGMQPAQITQVLATGNILYRVPVYSNSDGYISETAAALPAAPAATASAVPAGDGMGSMGGAAPASAPTASAPAASPVLLREGQYVAAGQPLFIIYQDQHLVAEFSFPPQLAARIKSGQSLLFYPDNDSKAMQTGRIGLVVPVFRNGENFTLARVYLDRQHFRIGQLLTASMPVMYTDGWWLPKKAVGRLGNTTVVFRKEKNGYVPEVVQTGVEAEDKIQVMTPIGGWQVASNAAYLVDSESFIKTNNSWKGNDL